MRPYRLRIEVDIRASDRDHAERLMHLLCSDLEHRSFVREVLANGLEERIPINHRKEQP